MSLDNNSANNFKDFLDAIKPYLNYQPVDLSCMGIDAFQFSTDEKPVGMWTDRKIVYAKTFVFTTPSTVDDAIVATMSNIDTLVDIRGIVGNSNPICFTYPTGGSSVAVTACYLSLKTNIRMKVRSDDVSKPCAITAYYTKTTDSPLSADEKFAGVTSGGEIIYEKTVSFTNKGSNSPMLEFDSGISIVDYCGFMENNNDKLPIVGYYWNSSEYCSSYVTNSGEKIRLSTSFSGKNVTVTVRYTKTP